MGSQLSYNRSRKSWDRLRAKLRPPNHSWGGQKMSAVDFSLMALKLAKLCRSHFISHRNLQANFVQNTNPFLSKYKSISLIILYSNICNLNTCFTAPQIYLIEIDNSESLNRIQCSPWKMYNPGCIPTHEYHILNASLAHTHFWQIFASQISK